MAADDTKFGTFYLTLRFDFIAAELSRRFGDVQHAFDMRLRYQAAVGVHRKLAADFDAAVLTKSLPSPFLQKP